MNAGAVIEDEVIIGAGTVVPPGKKLESGNIYVGSPCRLLRQTTEKERAFFVYSPANYVLLKDQYLKEIKHGLNNNG